MTQLKQNKVAYHTKSHALTNPFGLTFHCVSDAKTILSVKILAKTRRGILVSSVHYNKHTGIAKLRMCCFVLWMCVFNSYTSCCSWLWLWWSCWTVDRLY